MASIKNLSGKLILLKRGLLMLGFLVFFFPVTVKAQDGSSEGIFDPNDPYGLEKYVNPTIQNLSHLYWNLGALDYANSVHIDNFLMINECDMFTTYLNNDLEWEEMRESTRSFLRTNTKFFPTHFKIAIPLYLTRYDPEKQVFNVNMDKSSVNYARRIETIYYVGGTVCGRVGEIDGYPKNLVLLLSRPFVLPQVPVEQELARLFLDEYNAKNKVRAKMMHRDEAYERMAVLELFIKVMSFKGRVYGVGGSLKAAVFAQVDHIKVYADTEKQKLLWEKSMREEDSRARKKRTDIDEDLPPQVDLPEGSIFNAIKKGEGEAAQ
ncbi:MAG: DUF4852 domain-containing protein [Micavibrio sp.]